MRNKRSFEEQEVTTKVIGKEILQNISIATNYQLQNYNATTNCWIGKKFIIYYYEE